MELFEGNILSVYSKPSYNWEVGTPDAEVGIQGLQTVEKTGL